MLIKTIKLCPILVINITKIITLIIKRPKNRILINIVMYVVLTETHGLIINQIMTRRLTIMKHLVKQMPIFE